MYSGRGRCYSLYKEGTKIGEITAVVSHRSGEECADVDVIRSSEMLVGITKRNDSIVRSSYLISENGTRLTVLYAVHHKRFTMLTLQRAIYDGDGGIG